MSEPARTPDSGNGSRSTSRICEPQDLCSRRSSFSISTCTQIPPARIAHNTHPHRTSSLAPEVTSPVADFAQFQEYNRLAPPKTPPRKPHHKHSQSLQPGLLSPVSSFASFKAVFNPPRVPSPLSLSPSPLARSPRTRPTPLRLLRPFTSIVSPATPTPTLATAVASASVPRSSLLFATDSDEQPAMYHPKPQHPPSPSTSGSSNHLVRPTTPHRPPSRSEKLLREALMKDEHDRNPMPYTASPYPSGHPATSPVRSHQRRHSHVPSAREDGTFLVQRPVFNGLRSPSPSPAPDYHSSLSRRHSQGHGHHPQDQLHASSPYSLAQSPTSASPTRDRQARGHSPLARRSSVKSQSHQARPASPASHSRGYTHSHQSPSYTPSVTSSHYAPGSPSLSRRHVPRPLPLSPAPEAAHFQLPNEPLTMTPHEQVLRARLERVLQANANVNGRDGDLPRGGAEWMIGQAVDVDESTDSDENVVRDENGGRAWRKKHGAVLTPPSSGSNSARSLSKEDMLLKQTSALHHQHHQRSRSRTEPAPFTPSAAAAAGIASPKRSSTGPAPQSPYMSAKAQYHHQHRHQQHTHGGRSGTTPPLVSDSSPATPEEEEDPEDLRLLTPPPTPPSQAAYHHYSIGRG
ncbi:hypothetical protein FA15DRAFT_404372 [Coprinopsis marcescibilis]|uniref:Uncharacterized protein n=1 Tax=Coprinopsis marcescibilis TaxID=230819 RepID=A0A5C3KX60_COPMA|nr:hypothetical protein FA15DRAFT_404372 [Coprinopsis marcescibilis]